MLPAAASAQTLMAAPTANNGSGGVFMEFTPATTSLQIDAFETYFSSTAGTAVSVEVWTRPGNYAGFEGSNAGWTLHETAGAISAGSTALAMMTLNTPIPLAFGGTTAVYLHAITTGGGIRYNGTNALPPVTNYANPDLAMFSAHTRTGAVPFAGTLFTPRAFAGNVHYSVPAPGVMALMGLAGMAAARRRR